MTMDRFFDEKNIIKKNSKIAQTLQRASALKEKTQKKIDGLTPEQKASIVEGPERQMGKAIFQALTSHANMIVNLPDEENIVSERNIVNEEVIVNEKNIINEKPVVNEEVIKNEENVVNENVNTNVNDGTNNEKINYYAPNVKYNNLANRPQNVLSSESSSSVSTPVSVSIPNSVSVSIPNSNSVSISNSVPGQAREQSIMNQSIMNQSTMNQPVKDPVTNSQPASNQFTMEHSTKDSSIKNFSTKDSSIKDSSIKDSSTRGISPNKTEPLYKPDPLLLEKQKKAYNELIDLQIEFEIVSRMSLRVEEKLKTSYQTKMKSIQTQIKEKELRLSTIANLLGKR